MKKYFLKTLVFGLLLMGFQNLKAPTTDVPVLIPVVAAPAMMAVPMAAVPVPVMVTPTPPVGINYKFRISQGSFFVGLGLILGSDLTIRSLRLEKKELSKKEKKLLEKLKLTFVAGVGLFIAGIIGSLITSDSKKTKTLLDIWLTVDLIHTSLKFLFWLRGW